MDLVLLNSGGKDALATVMLLRKTQGYVIRSLFVRLGNPSEDRASAIAQKIAERYCDGHDEQIIPGLVPNLTVGGFAGIPHQAGILHLYAAGYAASRNIYALASGQNDEMCEPIKWLLQAVRGFRTPPLLLIPTKGMSHDEIFGVIKDEPLWCETVTCNREPACGKCPKCKLRAKWEGR